MNIRRLKWIAITAPIVFVGILEYTRYALAPILDSWQGHLMMAGVVLIGAIFFYGALFTIADQMQEKVENQNRELMALRSAGLDITSELSLDVVLQKVVDQACKLLGARYGALAIYDERKAVETFVTSGLSAEEIARMESPPPRGRGLLGVVLSEGQRLRMTDVREDERFRGFPASHPSIRSLLAVPVSCHSPCRGNLYLAERLDGRAFSAEDEDTLARFATQAAVAVDNAHFHAKVATMAVTEERLRLAREMHDGQAQVLAYVNTKAQAVQEFLRAGRTEQASEHLEQLAAAAREVYADVREGILGLRAVVDAEHRFAEALRSHVERWQDQCGTAAELVMDEVPDFPPDVELQLLRIVQEALANVRKHSRAERAKVTLRARPQSVHIVVEDDGVGFDREALGRKQMPRFGLATMRERAEAIGATLGIHSQVGAGTRVEIECPTGRDGAESTARPNAARPDASRLPMEKLAAARS